jgi:hypothetical protein
MNSPQRVSAERRAQQRDVYADFLREMDDAHTAFLDAESEENPETLGDSLRGTITAGRQSYFKVQLLGSDPVVREADTITRALDLWLENIYARDTGGKDTALNRFETSSQRLTELMRQDLETS